mgnify:CR=1 FL=1
MDCNECHGESGQPLFKVLSHESCTDCHDEPDAEVINKDTCGYCHQEKQIPLLKEWQEEPEVPLRNIFVHTEALAENCNECHSSLMADDLVSVPKLQRDDIVQIRDDAHSSGQDCLTCHVDMDRYQEPADHDHFWMKRHGVFGIHDDKACGVCHSEASCQDCHTVMQQMSHNNMWRPKPRGL